MWFVKPWNHTDGVQHSFWDTPILYIFIIALVDLFSMLISPFWLLEHPCLEVFFPKSDHNRSIAIQTCQSYNTLQRQVSQLRHCHRGRLHLLGLKKSGWMDLKQTTKVGELPINRPKIGGNHQRRWSWLSSKHLKNDFTNFRTSESRVTRISTSDPLGISLTMSCLPQTFIFCQP